MRINISLIVKRNIYVILQLVCFLADGAAKNEMIITVINPLGIERTETIEIPITKKMKLISNDANRLSIRDVKSGKIFLSQLLDQDGNGIDDTFIFQVTLFPNEKLKLELFAEEKTEKKTSAHTTFARLVPERLDDFAWENDLVAFRTYGPEAQRLVDEGKRGGTLSSGIDCWLKRVNYPIIDNWYKKFTEGGTYHKDDGEGYDPYHVGDSRGCGGIGVRVGDSLHVSKNFVHTKILANGPIRTVFELTYSPWQVNNVTITEKKKISIDLGSQLYHAEILLSTSKPIKNYVVGLTLHDKSGVVKLDSVNGWMSYWEKIDDAFLGTGIVMNPKYVERMIDHRTATKDQSQLQMVALPVKNKLEYYAGYGWQKAGLFTTENDWNVYLQKVAARIASPVQVTLK